MTEYYILKFLPVIGATVLLGTGAGIAFFMLMAHKSGDIRVIAGTARIVVIADYLFTATAVVAQQVTGVLLTWTVGYSLGEGWIVASLLLYVFNGLFWMQVVWMQSRMRTLARAAADAGTELPPEYHRLFRWWFAFGFPAFTAVMIIFWLMIARPEIGL